MYPVPGEMDVNTFYKVARDSLLSLIRALSLSHSLEIVLLVRLGLPNYVQLA